MKHIRFGESQAAKVEFTFVIESLELVPLKYKNFPMRIEWKRTSDNGKVWFGASMSSADLVDEQGGANTSRTRCL